MPDIKKARILIMAAHGFEQDELLVPRDKLRKFGAEVTVASPESGRIRGWDHTDWGKDAEVELTLDQVKVEDYDAIVLPGGQINPDLLRVNDKALDILRGFLKARKVVAAICHAPWLLVEVDAVRGREVTSYKSIKTDVMNAGGRWVDRSVVADQGIVTSRNPGDLRAFVEKIVEEIEEGRHSERSAA
ncbi:protease I [Tistlia consotensis]|uniref:Protease I n=1 Tax=Tistlia consotensis USBA 355 TaxID=560819 RepID=A0A1Y6CNC0_9PROT|nr:type 1 glutamine amidotransferase domain-containing protein [Tistlia consotensis]SMF78594.1 protease I [Tistlia consotensis USBA 355]SNS18831.1 protease I [Tistlia consotensis]